jgi:Amt family ammonium transporter
VAGLAAISAGCGLVDTWAAVLIGAVAGALAVRCVLFCEKRGVDDPVGAISVHGAGGLWGLLAVGLLANGGAPSGSGAGGAPLGSGVVHGGVLAGPGYDGVRGFFYGDASQLAAQLLGAATLVVFAFVTAYAGFKLSSLLAGIRVGRDTELAGLDAPEMGSVGYPDFTVTSRP